MPRAVRAPRPPSQEPSTASTPPWGPRGPTLWPRPQAVQTGVLLVSGDIKEVERR